MRLIERMATEVNTLSHKKEKFSFHLSVITHRLCKFEKKVNARINKLNDDVEIDIKRFETLSLE